VVAGGGVDAKSEADEEMGYAPRFTPQELSHAQRNWVESSDAVTLIQRSGSTLRRRKRTGWSVLTKKQNNQVL